MSKPTEKKIELIEYVENLNEEVKELALNLAIYLAKRNKDSAKLSKMEPEFIKLVNGAVKVGQELTIIINAAKNKESLVYDVPSGKFQSDHLESKLNMILGQCKQILEELGCKDEYNFENN